MANCTRAHAWRRRLAAAGALAALAGALVASPAARADGDPASDVLALGSLFLPADAGSSAAQQAQLAALIAQAARAGYQLRVALVASRADLGSVTPLWRRPQTYADFLGVELSLDYHGPLLVIMPDGFGLYGGPVAAERSALGSLRPRAGPGGLTSTALAAVQRLAGSAGHALSLPGAATPEVRPGPGDAPAWMAFAVGLLLVALAWSASLRARPVGRGAA